MYSVDNIPTFLPRGPSHSAAKRRFLILFEKQIVGPMFGFCEYENTAKGLEYVSIFFFPSGCSAVFHCQPCQEGSFKNK